MELTQGQYSQLRDFIYDQAGIALGEGKVSLVNARLNTRLRSLHLTSFSQYLDFLKKDINSMEVVQLLDCISTNFTSFFREPAHFDLLAKEVKAAIGRGQRRFRMWSAAASTGEEPYTIAMVVSETLGSQNAYHLDWRLLATDISTRVLASFEKGYYESDAFKRVPIQYHKYFTRQGNGHLIDPALREKMLIRRLNLSRPPFPMKGPLDIIFCRNVLIYFDDRVRESVFREAMRLLRPGGLFIVGLSESLTGMRHDFEYVSPSVYRKGES